MIILGSAVDLNAFSRQVSHDEFEDLVEGEIAVGIWVQYSEAIFKCLLIECGSRVDLS